MIRPVNRAGSALPGRAARPRAGGARGLPRPQARAALRRRGEEAVASDADELERLAAELAPDLAGTLRERVVQPSRRGSGSSLRRRQRPASSRSPAVHLSTSRPSPPTPRRLRSCCSRTRARWEHRRLRAGVSRRRRRRRAHYRRQRPLAPRRTARGGRASLRAAGRRGRRGAGGRVRSSRSTRVARTSASRPARARHPRLRHRALRAQRRDPLRADPGSASRCARGSPA